MPHDGFTDETTGSSWTDLHEICPFALIMWRQAIEHASMLPWIVL